MLAKVSSPWKLSEIFIYGRYPFLHVHQTKWNFLEDEQGTSTSWIQSCGLSWVVRVSAQCMKWTEHWLHPLNKDFHITWYLWDTFSGTGYKRKRKHVYFYWYVFSIAERLESNCPPLVPEGERRSGFSNRKEGCGVVFLSFYLMCMYVYMLLVCTHLSWCMQGSADNL